MSPNCLKTANYQGRLYPINQEGGKKTKLIGNHAVYDENISCETFTLNQVLFVISALLEFHKVEL